MTKSIQTIILLLSFVSDIKGQQLSTVINDNAITDFFSWRLDQKKGNQGHRKIKRVNQTKLTLDLSDINMTDAFLIDPRKKKFIDSTLTTEDKTFIASQIDTTKKTWSKSVFKSPRLIIPKDLMKMGKKDDYYEFSQPLFSKDMKKCIIKQAYHCGFMCSDWKTLLLEKTESGEWKLILTISALAA